MKNITLLLAISYQLLTISHRAEGQCTLGIRIASVTNISCYGGTGTITANAATGGTAVPIIITASGGGFSGLGNGGPATSAELYLPVGVLVDGNGNLYIADYGNNMVREVNTSGIINTIAGNGIQGYSGDGGSATSAELSSPYGVAIDGNDDIYIADHSNNRIREITGGIINTFAGNGVAGYSGDGGPPTAAELNGPFGVAVDGFSNIYIADFFNDRIGGVGLGMINTVAGGGSGTGNGIPATDAELGGPYGVAVDASGNIYIAGQNEQQLFVVNTSGIINTVAGNGTGGYSGDGGPATAAELYGPSEVAVSASGNIYIDDLGNNRIREVNTAGIITTIAGNGTAGFSGDGGPAVMAELSSPYGVCVDSHDNVYIADQINDRVREITLNATTYVYSWSPRGGTNLTASNLSAGTYTITATDSAGCVATASATISQPPLLQDSINSSCATCCNCKGTTHVYVWGGTPPYTYSWSNGRTNDTLVGLASGSYTATVTDSNGCVVMDTVFVHKGSEVIASQTNILCNGQSNGSATIIVAGNYSYSWSPGGETTSSINGLSVGSYNVTITNNDTAGCSATYSFNITQPQPLMVETFSPTCSSGGEITSSVSGGTLPYTYAWIGGIFGDSGTSVYPNPTCINNFRGATLTVSDNNGCTAFSGTWAYLPPISQLDIISGTDVSCFGENNGSIYVHGCGGQMGIGYTFTLSPTGQVVNTDSNYTFTNLAPGSYDIGFYFGNCGALISVPVTITQPPALSITADTINASPGNCDGSAWATVSGGAAPYTYSWTGGLTTDTIYNQCAGYYCCTITDANGCIDSVCTNIETSTATNEVKGEKEKVKVYPNPNDGIFIIQMVNGELSVVNDEIQVYNVLGQQVYSQFNIQHPTFNIDLSSQPDGVYFYRVLYTNGGLIGEGKLVIQK